MSTATDVREQVVELAREFAKEKIEPFAAEWDATSTFREASLDELGKLGFLGMCTPEEYDGRGLDTLTYLMVLENLCRRCRPGRVGRYPQRIPTTMLVKHGTRNRSSAGSKAWRAASCWRDSRSPRPKRAGRRVAARSGDEGRQELGAERHEAWATNAGPPI